MNFLINNPARKINDPNFNAFYWEKEIDPSLKKALTFAYVEKIRVTFDFGDTKTGKSWGEIYDISGRIGRTTGTKQIPILVHNSRSFGGGAILTNCILSIKYANKKQGGVIWRHPILKERETNESK